MSRIDRIRRAVSSRGVAKTETDRTEAGSGEPANALVPSGPVITFRHVSSEHRRGDSEFEAHRLGQDGERRGLREGLPLLDRARMAYNRIEWSGAFDRRARKGRQAREDI